MLAKTLIIGRIAAAPTFQAAAGKRTEARVLITSSLSPAASAKPAHVILTSDAQQIRLLQHHGQIGRLWLAEGRLDYASIPGRSDRTAFIRCDFGLMAPLDDVSLALAGQLPPAGRFDPGPGSTPGAMQAVTLVGRIAAAPEYQRTPQGQGVEARFDLVTTRQYASRQSGDYITQSTTHRIVTSVPSQILLLQQHGRRTRLFMVTGQIDYLAIPGRDEHVGLILCDESSVMRPLDDVTLLDPGTADQAAAAHERRSSQTVVPDTSTLVDNAPAPAPPRSPAPEPTATTNPDDDSIWLE